MPRKMLIAYSMVSTFVQTTLDYLLMIQKHIGYEVDFVHVTHDAIMDFSLDQYDVIFNNYCARHCFPGYVSKNFCDALAHFRGLKVLAVQDEYDFTENLRSAIEGLGFNVVLTCVPQASLEYVYPRSRFAHVEFISVFTGYVPQSLIERASKSKSLSERPIFIGYRGRDIGGRYGRLGFDKYEIGRRMKAECDQRGIATDIAMDEESRIYGTAWFDFIGDCRAMLGSESGSNVFDFDGDLDRTFKTLTDENHGARPSYAEFAPYVSHRESEISMGQISPRIFECAALRTPMVLYRGRYSDAIEPDEHYLALERDFSNIEDVLARLDDVPSLTAMAERAYKHLIGSGQFTYEAFCHRLRECFDARLAALDRQQSATERAPTPSVIVTEKDKSLAERPTRFPLGLAEFRDKSLREHAAAQATENARLDQIYADEVQRLLAICAVALKDEVNNANSRLEHKQDKEAVSLSYKRLQDCRDGFLRRRVNLLSELDRSRQDNDFVKKIHCEADLARLETDWYSELPSHYTDHIRKLNSFIDAYKKQELASAAEQFAPAVAIPLIAFLRMRQRARQIYDALVLERLRLGSRLRLMQLQVLWRLLPVERRAWLGQRFEAISGKSLAQVAAAVQRRGAGLSASLLKRLGARLFRRDKN